MGRGGAGKVAAIKESPLKPLCLCNNALLRPSLCGMLMRTAKSQHDSLARRRRGRRKRGRCRGWGWGWGRGSGTLVSRCQLRDRKVAEGAHQFWNIFEIYFWLPPESMLRPRIKQGRGRAGRLSAQRGRFRVWPHNYLQHLSAQDRRQSECWVTS